MSATFFHDELTAGDIRAELSRILASAYFGSSIHLSHFLQHIVNGSLAGRAHKIKERNIAVSALVRDADFDPRLEPLVRVLAGKLRRTLERYYAAEGAGNTRDGSNTWVVAYDASKQQLKTIFSTSGGVFARGTMYKKDEQWFNVSEGCQPDGTKTSWHHVVTISDDGETHTWDGKVTIGDEPAVETHEVYHRIGK